MSVVLVKTENSRRLKEQKLSLGHATHSQTKVPTVDEDLRSFSSGPESLPLEFLLLATTIYVCIFFLFLHKRSFVSRVQHSFVRRIRSYCSRAPVETLWNISFHDTIHATEFVTRIRSVCRRCTGYGSHFVIA